MSRAASNVPVVVRVFIIFIAPLAMCDYRDSYQDFSIKQAHTRLSRRFAFGCDNIEPVIEN